MAAVTKSVPRSRSWLGPQSTSPVLASTVVSRGRIDDHTQPAPDSPALRSAARCGDPWRAIGRRCCVRPPSMALAAACTRACERAGRASWATVPASCAASTWTTWRNFPCAAWSSGCARRPSSSPTMSQRGRVRSSNTWHAGWACQCLPRYRSKRHRKPCDTTDKWTPQASKDAWQWACAIRRTARGLRLVLSRSEWFHSRAYPEPRARAGTPARCDSERGFACVARGEQQFAALGGAGGDGLYDRGDFLPFLAAFFLLAFFLAAFLGAAFLAAFLPAFLRSLLGGLSWRPSWRPSCPPSCRPSSWPPSWERPSSRPWQPSSSQLSSSSQPCFPPAGGCLHFECVSACASALE